MKTREFKNTFGCVLIMFLAAFTFANMGCSGNGDEDDVITYTVTFDAGGGTPGPEVQKVEAGGTASAPATNPAKTGYVFLFWHLSGATTAYNFETPVTGNITLQAKWEEEAKVEYWQVSWELNGGAWPASGDNHATQVVRGGTLAEPVAPTKAGKKFDGWYKEADLTSKVSFPYHISAVTSDFTLYAKWEDAAKADYFGTWRVVVSADGDNAFWEQITISSDKAVYLNKNGYGFTMGDLTWVKTNNSGGSYKVDYPEGYKVTGILKMKNNYDVPKASGSGNAAVGDVALNSYYIGADKQSIRIGNFKTAGQEAQYGPYTKKLNVEYWQVTWNLNGGAWPANDNHAAQVAKDGKLAAPTAPTKTDKYFDGWYKEASLTNKVSFPYDAGSITGNFTLFAKWLDTAPTATLKITVSPGAGFYTSLSVMGAKNYNIPTSAGTHTIQVSPATYKIYYSYMSCPYVSCSSAGYSGNFTVSSGQTKNISVVGSAVGF